MQREVFAKLGVSSLEDLGLEDWSQLLSPGSPNSVSGFHHFEGSQQVRIQPGHACKRRADIMLAHTLPLSFAELNSQA